MLESLFLSSCRLKVLWGLTPPSCLLSSLASRSLSSTSLGGVVAGDWASSERPAPPRSSQDGVANGSAFSDVSMHAAHLKRFFLFFDDDEFEPESSASSVSDSEGLTPWRTTLRWSRQSGHPQGARMQNVSFDVQLVTRHAGGWGGDDVRGLAGCWAWGLAILGRGSAARSEKEWEWARTEANERLTGGVPGGSGVPSRGASG